MKEQKNNTPSKRITGYIVLFAIVTLSFFLRYPLTTYNLPICANVDERKSLEILYRFENISLNPDFFHYPTFYYYVTHFLIKPFTKLNGFLFYARILNLLFACVLGISVFFLSKQFYESTFSSVIATSITLFDPIVIRHSSYIIPDILLAVLSIWALLFFAKFFKVSYYKYWLLGILFTGLAISTKYPAIIVVVSYVIFEFKRSPVPISNPTTNKISTFLNKRFDPKIISLFLFVSATIIFVAYLFMPSPNFILRYINHGNFDSVIDMKDIRFIQFLRTMFFIVSIAMLLLVFIIYRFKNLFRRFCIIRPYIGFILIMLFFLLGSPYVLISGPAFLYDLGTELKTNMLSSGEQQWVQYLLRYFNMSSIIVLFFFCIGLWTSFQQKKGIKLLILYLVLFMLAIGSAHRGHAKYLIPMLPVIFIIASWGITSISIFLQKYRANLRYIFVFTIIIIVGLELYPKVLIQLQRASEKDEMYCSYIYINELHPNKIYYAGYHIPYVELAVQKFCLEQIPRRWLTEGDIHFLEDVKANQILIVDKEINQITNKVFKNYLKLLWSTDDGYGQYIYVKNDQKPKGLGQK